jgi:hypothetical protein
MQILNLKYLYVHQNFRQNNIQYYILRKTKIQLNLDQRIQMTCLQR